MPTQTLRLAGKENVVVPKREFVQLTKRAGAGKTGVTRRVTLQEKGDVAEAKRLAAKNEKTISLAELRRELGI